MENDAQERAASMDFYMVFLVSGALQLFQVECL